jgi:hypothetical protein
VKRRSNTSVTDMMESMTSSATSGPPDRMYSGRNMKTTMEIPRETTATMVRNKPCLTATSSCPGKPLSVRSSERWVVSLSGPGPGERIGGVRPRIRRRTPPRNPLYLKLLVASSQLS